MDQDTGEKMFQLREEFQEHVERFEAHEKHEAETLTAVVEGQRRNVEAIGALTVQVSALVKDTSDIIQLNRDIQGVVRIGSGVQHFTIWCLKWGGIIGGIGAAVTVIVNHFSKGH